MQPAFASSYLASAGRTRQGGNRSRRSWLSMVRISSQARGLRFMCGVSFPAVRTSSLYLRTPATETAGTPAPGTGSGTLRTRYLDTFLALVRHRHVSCPLFWGSFHSHLDRDGAAPAVQTNEVPFECGTGIWSLGIFWTGLPGHSAFSLRVCLKMGNLVGG